MSAIRECIAKNCLLGIVARRGVTRAEKGVRLKVDADEWDFSQAEVAWVVKRMHYLLQAVADDCRLFLAK